MVFFTRLEEKGMQRFPKISVTNALTLKVHVPNSWVLGILMLVVVNTGFGTAYDYWLLQPLLNLPFTEPNALVQRLGNLPELRNQEALFRQMGYGYFSNIPYVTGIPESPL